MSEPGEFKIIPLGEVLNCAAGEVAKLYITDDEGGEVYVALALDIIRPDNGEVVVGTFGFHADDAHFLGAALCEVAVKCGFIPEDER